MNIFRVGFEGDLALGSEGETVAHNTENAEQMLRLHP